MMKSIIYSGHELLDTSFFQNQSIREKSYYQFQVRHADELNFQEIFDYHHQHTHNELSVLFYASVNGFIRNITSPAYTLDIHFLVRFMISKNQFIEKKYLEEHTRFFMHYASQAARSLIDSILTFNAIAGSHMPSVSTGQSEEIYPLRINTNYLINSLNDPT